MVEHQATRMLPTHEKGRETGGRVHRPPVSLLTRRQRHRAIMERELQRKFLSSGRNSIGRLPIRNGQILAPASLQHLRQALIGFS